MVKAGSLEAVEASSKVATPKRTRGIAVFDLVLRLLAIAGTLGSSVGMGSTEEVLPFSTQFFRFDAQFDDFDAFKLFVIVNSIACAYLALSLPISIYHIIRRRASGKTRVLLVFLDTAMLAFLTAGASAAAAIVYLAHYGNSAANWFSVCQQYQNFCQSTSGALIGAFGAMTVFVLLIILSGVALLSRH